jgi:hypothetical protein
MKISGGTMNQLPANCPICGGSVVVTKFDCHGCGSSVSGEFAQTGNPFSALGADQIEFLKVFVKCEGRLNRMEGELGVSYPTIRNRLQDLVKTMGYEPSKDEPRDAAPKPMGEDERRRILDELDAGRLNAEQAMKMLRGEA